MDQAKVLLGEDICIELLFTPKYVVDRAKENLNNVPNFFKISHLHSPESISEF